MRCGEERRWWTFRVSHPHLIASRPSTVSCVLFQKRCSLGCVARSDDRMAQQKRSPNAYRDASLKGRSLDQASPLPCSRTPLPTSAWAQRVVLPWEEIRLVPHTEATLYHCRQTSASLGARCDDRPANVGGEERVPQTRRCWCFHAVVPWGRTPACQPDLACSRRTSVLCLRAHGDGDGDPAGWNPEGETRGSGGGVSKPLNRCPPGRSVPGVAGPGQDDPAA